MKDIKAKTNAFLDDESGSVLIYVSLFMVIIFGFVGLAIDASRITTSHSTARAAAESAAIAAARQLDGGTDSITRADTAASTFVGKSQFFADQAAAGNITISMRYLTDLPADDEAPIPAGFYTNIPADALYAEATTELLNHDNLFLPAIGIASTANVRAVAVAGQTSAICRVTPLAICNPAEATGGAGAEFNYNEWVGKQILVRKGGADSDWAPGNFGLLDATEGQGTPDLADQLAAIDGAEQCFSTKLDTKPGSVNALRPALNTRFDIYDNPGFKGETGNERYPPAQNVTKGYEWTGNPANLCKTYDEPSTHMGLPRDNIFTSPGSSVGRFGNGKWDCLTYWSTNHPGVAVPNAGCANNSSGYSRYQVYRYEIDNDMIPGKTAPPTGTNGPENGAPVCYDGDPIDYTTIEDRRIVHFAVMNCTEHGVQGNSSDVPSEAIVKAFLTEPAGGTGVDINVYLEVVDVVESGDADGVLKEFVEILR